MTTWRVSSNTLWAITIPSDLKISKHVILMIEAEERALMLLYNIDSYIAPHLTGISCPGDPAMQYCWDQASFHLRQAQELLESVVVNPHTHYDGAREFYQNLGRVLPLMVYVQSFGSPPLDQESAESSPGSTSSDQSDLSTYEPDTPPLSPSSVLP